MAKRARTNSRESKPRFDEQFNELQSIVLRLEEGSLGLEDALAEFETGVGLLKSCTRILDDVDRRIEILVGFDADGAPLTKPFDAAATHDEGTATHDPIATARRGNESADHEADGGAEGESGGDPNGSRGGGALFR